MKANYELAKLQQDFKAFYDKNLRQKYEQLEPAREKYLNKFWRRFIICTAIVLFVIFLCINGTISKELYTSEGFLKIFIFIIIAMGYICITPFFDYCVETKSLVMDKILSFWGTFQYSFTSTVDSKDIEKSEIFGQFDSTETDDSFEGTHKNTKISVSEKKLLVKGSKNDYSIFSGVIILLKFNKKFKGKTVVKHRGNFGSMFKNNLRAAIWVMLLGIMIASIASIFVLAEDSFEVGLFIYMSIIIGSFVVLGWLQLFKGHKKATQKVKLEEITFNREWKVLTDNQVAARYILTPVFMEKINDVRKLFHGRHIDFSFFNDKLMLAVHTRKDMFETTSLFTPALDYAKVREVVSQLYSIFAVIDILQEKGEK